MGADGLNACWLEVTRFGASWMSQEMGTLGTRLAHLVAAITRP